MACVCVCVCVCIPARPARRGVQRVLSVKCFKVLTVKPPLSTKRAILYTSILCVSYYSRLNAPPYIPKRATL